MDDLLEAARAALSAGLCVIPAAKDGTKAPWPDGPRWAKYQSERPEPGQLERWFTGDGYPGMGLVCGEISGGLEMLEFEGRAVTEGVYDQFLEAAKKAGLLPLVDRVADGYMEYTPSGGLHWLYRCSVTATTKLARRPATAAELADRPDEHVKVLAETKGEGGFVIVAPSGGPTHPSGRPWELHLGGFDEIVTIEPDEREAIHELFRMFDAMPSTSHVGVDRLASSSDERPGDEYNVKTTWHELLEPAGWAEVGRHGDEIWWRRPGKTVGISATTNHTGTDRLKVFSTSTLFDAETTYDRFGAYAQLEHNGDLAGAARTLRRKGYGGVATKPEIGGSDDGASEFRSDTDTGNALRLVDNHGDKLRHVRIWGTWLAWDGKRWRRDETGEVVERAKDVAVSIYTEAAVADNSDDRKRLSKWARQTESATRIRAMIDLATSDPNLALRAHDVDKNPWLLNVRNGTLDLRRGALRAHRQDDLLTRLVDIEYQADASCPRWLEFLDWAMLGRAELVTFLQRAVGYTLSGRITEQCLFFLYGAGSNGKSTLLHVLMALLGDYATQTEPDLLLARRSDPHPTGLADLVGKRCAVAVEVEQGRRMAESLVKQLTGGDRVKARFMRQDFFEFEPTHKLWLAANHKPIVRGTDNAIWRRIRMVPFEATMPDELQDKDLTDKLRDELPGILAWAVQGCVDWQSDGLGLPSEVAEATLGYRGEMDIVGQFLEDECDTNDVSSTLVAAAGDLYREYRTWCERAGERPVTQRALALMLQERGFENVKAGRQRTRVWRGLRLLNVDSLLDEPSNGHVSDEELFGDPPSGRDAPAANGQVNGQIDTSAGALVSNSPMNRDDENSRGDIENKRPRAPAGKPDICTRCGKPADRLIPAFEDDTQHLCPPCCEIVAGEMGT